VRSINRVQETHIHHSSAGPLDYNLHIVIGAAGFAYPSAIKKFIETEKESKGNRAGSGSDSDSSESSESQVSWERTVREIAGTRSSGKGAGNIALPFRDILFHRAAKSQNIGYRAYVQFFCRGRHGMSWN
jgi:hypothetical protein